MAAKKKNKPFVAFRLDKWQADALAALAAEDMRSRNSLMRAVISDYIRTRMSPEQLALFKPREQPEVEDADLVKG